MRYFSCPAQHGVFAAIQKVSLYKGEWLVLAAFAITSQQYGSDRSVVEC